MCLVLELYFQLLNPTLDKCIDYHKHFDVNSDFNSKHSNNHLISKARSQYDLIIGPESDHWQCLSHTHLLTNSLTH